MSAPPPQVLHPEALTLNYQASGRGFVQLSVTLVYEAEEANLLVPGDGAIGTVPVDQVIGDGRDVAGEPLRCTCTSSSGPASGMGAATSARREVDGFA